MFFQQTHNITRCPKPPEIYDNFIVMGNFNTDVNLLSYEHDKLREFCNLFDLSNLIKSNTCFTKTHSSKTELILTNHSNYFKKSGTTKRV